MIEIDHEIRFLIYDSMDFLWTVLFRLSGFTQIVILYIDWKILIAGHGPPPGLPLHHNMPPGADTDISNDSSPRGYPDFPPSPDSWLGEPSSAHY